MSVATAEPMPNFARSIPASNALSAELWISFAGLLRSHVAMRSVTEPNAGWKIVSNEPSSLEVGGWGHKLKITAPEGARTGNIAWPTERNKESEPFATFSFGEDGKIFFVTPPATAGPEAMEMETAVEFLLDALRERSRA